MKKLSYLLAVWALVALNACVIDASESGANAAVETQTDTFIDPDATKESALGLIFGMPQIDDRLDYSGGDREDWRYIIVAEQGVMSVTINVDQPQKVDGGWNIIDSEGRVLHRQSFSKTEGYYEFSNFPVKRGIYYFQVYATAGKSIYTIATSFTPSIAVPVPPPVVENDVVEEEEEEEEAPRTVKKSTPKPSKKRVSKRQDDDDDEPAPPKVEKPATTGKTIKGFISLITPKADGSAEVTIRNAGKNKGIETGVIGRIVGTSIKIEMTQCFPTSCRALVPASANPKGLKQGADVEFSL